MEYKKDGNKYTKISWTDKVFIKVINAFIIILIGVIVVGVIC